jgi:predicted membrane GTPase involved in stress response
MVIFIIRMDWEACSLTELSPLVVNNNKNKIKTKQQNISHHSIGIHQRPGDLEVNVCKLKALTNMRAASKDVKTGVITAIDMSLDSCVEYIGPDEILEVTPSLFRMSKNPDMAKKSSRVNK